MKGLEWGKFPVRDLSSDSIAFIFEPSTILTGIQLPLYSMSMLAHRDGPVVLSEDLLEDIDF
jgi:hypothetical protein